MKNKDVEVTPASIIFSDMREINGEVVYPYDLMLKLYEWDAVWVVGGEVGGVDVVGVGVGQEEQHDVIFLYVTHNAPSQVSQFSKEDWLGFPVVVRRSGGITPAVP
jgi:hypothetical protein